MDRLEAHKMFFAQLVTASVGVPATERNLIEAFASTPRERFVGDGPWQVFTRGGYIQTPSDDPAFLYQDITVALKSEGQINNGQPTLHAVCLAVLGVKEGEVIVHIGAGTAQFVCGAMFIPCVGARDDETAQKLSDAFKRGDMGNVRSLRRDTSPDATCWLSGRGWWLSAAPLE